MKKATTIFVVMAVIIAAGSFYGGMMYEKSQATTLGAVGGFGGQGMMGQGGQGGANGQGRGNGNWRGMPGGGRPVNGTISKIDGNSLTVKTQDGSSKIVLMGKSTQIGKFSTGSNKDLKNGEQVMVIGTTNSDGSVTATMVQLGARFGQRPLR